MASNRLLKADDDVFGTDTINLIYIKYLLHYLLVSSISLPNEAKSGDSVNETAGLLAEVLALVDPGCGVARHPRVHDEGTTGPGVHPPYDGV